MRKIIIFSIPLAFVLVGCGANPGTHEPRTVAVSRAMRTQLTNAMTLQGEFFPFQDVMIHAKVSGYVNPISVDIGDKVKAGQLLATLEVPELKDQVIGSAASMRRAAIERDIAHLNYQRLVEVSRSHPNLVAQQELDDAQAKDAAASAALETAKSEADKFASLSDYTRVLAPFDGVITRRFVDNGALVEAGTSSTAGPIVELAQSSLLRLRFPVPEAETPLVHDGGVVSISIESLQQAFKGTIARDSWDIDRATRTLVVEVDVPNKDGAIKAGMYASVSLPTQDAKGVIAVPLQAISPGESPTVLVATSAGVVEERKVSLGIRTASLAEVRSGLNEGDLVIVGDRSGLLPGTPVSAKITEVPEN